MKHNLLYPYILKRLSEEDGGGYLIEFPDLPGCMSDGETEEEAILMGKDAVFAWIETAKELNRPIPQPSQKIEKLTL
jgi:antitoxin HicB